MIEEERGTWGKCLRDFMGWSCGKELLGYSKHEKIRNLSCSYYYSFETEMIMIPEKRKQNLVFYSLSVWSHTLYLLCLSIPRENTSSV